MGFTLAQKSTIDHIVEVVSAGSLAPEPVLLPAEIINGLEGDGIEPQEIYKIIGPKDELLRLVDDHDTLSLDQTERAARLAHIVKLAEAVFGKKEKAFLWLRCPNPELGNRQPLECLGRESAARAVEEALTRIDYGIIG